MCIFKWNSQVSLTVVFYTQKNVDPSSPIKKERRSARVLFHLEKKKEEKREEKKRMPHKFTGENKTS